MLILSSFIVGRGFRQDRKEYGATVRREALLNPSKFVGFVLRLICSLDCEEAFVLVKVRLRFLLASSCSC